MTPHEVKPKLVMMTIWQPDLDRFPGPRYRAIAEALHGPELVALQERLAAAQHRASEALAGVHLPQMPTRDEILAGAKAMFAKTPSIDEIVDRAHDMLLAAVGARLAAAN